MAYVASGPRALLQAALNQFADWEPQEKAALLANRAETDWAEAATEAAYTNPALREEIQNLEKKIADAKNNLADRLGVRRFGPGSLGNVTNPTNPVNPGGRRRLLLSGSKDWRSSGKVPAMDSDGQLVSLLAGSAALHACMLNE